MVRSGGAVFLGVCVVRVSAIVGRGPVYVAECLFSC